MSDAPLSAVGVEAIADMVALAERSPPGCFVEVGVYRGGTAWHLARIAREQGRVLHLFDTFTGIPYRGPEDEEHHVGDFGDTSVEAVKAAIPDAVFHAGIFPESMIGASVGLVAFAHIDCDQYKSVMDSIVNICPLMPFDSVMLFDDYDATTGCTKAVNQFFTPNQIRRTSQGKAYVVKELHHA